MKDLAHTFSALSDPTRLELVEKMMTRGELPVGELAAGAGISAPAISRHLKVLRQAGLIRQRVEGTRRYCSVQPEAIQAISDWTMDHRQFWKGGLERLEGLLALDPGPEDNR